jgi:hypothetical protein
VFTERDNVCLQMATLVISTALFDKGLPTVQVNFTFAIYTPELATRISYILRFILVSHIKLLLHVKSSGCGWRRRPTDMEGSCEYIE